MKSNITRRNFLRITGLTAAGIIAGSHRYAAKETGSRPNIIFILADDLGYGDIGCLNSESKIPTPNLDKLASQGMTFTDAHSSSSLCSPTRYGILTGRYSWRSRRQGGALWSFDPPLIEEGRLTFPQYLKNKGYHTACFGKWHLGMNWHDKEGNILENTGSEKGWNIDFSRPLKNGPTSRGFDYFFGTDAPNYPPYCYIENDRTIGIPTEAKPTSMYGVPGIMLKDWDLYKVLPEIEKRAVNYINRESKSDNSFFLYLPLTAPHTPIVPIEEHLGKSQAGLYGDFVHQVDAIVGNILKTLDQNNLTENTLLIFTSDNGSPNIDGFGSPSADGSYMEGEKGYGIKYGHNSSYIFRGKKADVWEGGHRIPFFVRWPDRIKAGSKTDEVVCLTDLFATCAAIFGDKLPDSAGEDSYNILPVLTGERINGKLREATVHLSGDGSFSIRQGKWKMEITPGSGGGGTLSAQTAMRNGLPMIQLYNLEEDIGEKNNLFDKYPDVVFRLTKLLEKYVKNGRSTPGTPQKNTGEPDIWRSLNVRNEKFSTNKVEHIAIGKKVKLLNDVELKFSKDGANVLTDGIRASSWFDDGYWTAVEGGDMEYLLDLGEIKQINNVSAGFLEAQSYWIFYPKNVELSLSLDGKSFSNSQIIKRTALKENDIREIKNFSASFKNKKCRYIKMKAVGQKICPQWHKGAGGKAWVCADEIIVE